MRYMPAQVKEALEITEETLRYWRQRLPPLKGKRGYAPCFSPGDLLALKVVTQIHGLGVNVGELVSHSAEFFKACSQGVWFGLEDKVLVFDGQTMELISLCEEGDWGRQTRIAVPLGPLIRQLRQRLSDEEPNSTQPEIAFPPLGVAQGRLK
jgi:hypothetical protein